MFFSQSKISCPPKLISDKVIIQEKGIRFVLLLSLIFFHSACESNRAAVLQQQCCTGEMRDIQTVFTTVTIGVFILKPAGIFLGMCAWRSTFPRLLLLLQIMSSLNCRAPLVLGDVSVCAVRAIELNPFLRAASRERMWQRAVLNCTGFECEL